jgi:hypothetical protein
VMFCSASLICDIPENDIDRIDITEHNGR